MNGHLLPPDLTSFFLSGDWFETLPKPREVTISSDGRNREGDRLLLPTVRSFKGLEADGIVLFLRSPRDELEANLYVGISRARLLLCVIAHADVLSRTPRLGDHGHLPRLTGR